MAILDWITSPVLAVNFHFLINARNAGIACL